MVLPMAAIVGCQRPVRDITMTVRKPTVSIETAALSQAWDEILDVLREHNMEPDRQDFRARIITTHPEVSGQWFEFWRADAQGLYQRLESSLHTIRRRVEVRFQPADGRLKLDLVVHVQRKTQPERQVTTASGALQIYREKLPIYTGEKLPAGEGVYWVDLGTDPLFEKYLLERIRRRLPGQNIEIVSPVRSGIDRP